MIASFFVFRLFTINSHRLIVNNVLFYVSDLIARILYKVRVLVDHILRDGQHV